MAPVLLLIAPAMNSHTIQRPSLSILAAIALALPASATDDSAVPDPLRKPMPALTSQGKPVPSRPSAPTGGSIWRSLGALILVVGGLLVVQRIVQKMGRPFRVEDRSLQVLEKLPVDRRNAVLLIRAATRTLVVGVGPQGMTTLAVLDGDGQPGTKVPAGVEEKPA
jgi:flagellar biogenesis protein FliO